MNHIFRCEHHLGIEIQWTINWATSPFWFLMLDTDFLECKSMQFGRFMNHWWKNFICLQSIPFFPLRNIINIDGTDDDLLCMINNAKICCTRNRNHSIWCWYDGYRQLWTCILITECGIRFVLCVNATSGSNNHSFDDNHQIILIILFMPCFHTESRAFLYLWNYSHLK